MKLFYLMLIVLCNKISIAQSCIDIKYSKESLNISVIDRENIREMGYDFEKNSLKYRMLINDSFALIYQFNESFYPFKNDSIIGGKLVHHGIFYDYVKGVKYEEITFPKKRKELILMNSSLKMNYTILENYQKNILGFNCKAAVAINSQLDSILIWFTNDMKIKNGNLTYDGAPGIVLEVYDQVFKNAHILAYSVEKVKIKLIEPTEGIIITMSDFYLRKNKQKF